MDVVAPPIRVLWLAKGLGLGGTEHLIVRAVSHFDRARFEIDVAYVLPWKDALVPELAALGVTTHCLGRGRGRWPGWVLRLRRLLATGRYDIVHTHMPYPAVAARLLARRSTRLLHTEHNVWPRYRWPVRAANALTYRRNSAVVAVSEAVASTIRPPGGGPPVHVVVHGVDHQATHRGPEARAAARAALDLPADAFVVGTIGSLTVKKDHATLLAAVAELDQARPGVHVVVIGGGPLEGELHQRVSDLGLRDRARLTGARSDARALLPAFDTFVLSSRHEGLPIALIEAMAAGLPCVATSVGGIPEVLEDGVGGFLVAPGDATALANAIGKLREDDTLRAAEGERAAEVAAGFEMGPAVAETAQLYERVLRS